MSNNENPDLTSRKSAKFSIQKSSAKLADEYLTDIGRMLSHIRDQGIMIPENLNDEVGFVYSLKDAHVLDEDGFKRIVQLHGKLSALITPATPRSLSATDFCDCNKYSNLTVLLLLFFIIAAFSALYGYVKTIKPGTGADLQKSTDANMATLIVSDGNEPAEKTDVISGTLYDQRNYLCAAMIGAAFNGLLTMYRYLRNRSFEPNYMGIYIIRFVVGVLAGVVLANFCSGLFQGNSVIAKLGQGVIALLGGYSAEAVRQILDRLVEVLLTVVKGAADAASQERLAISKDMLSIAQEAADPKTPVGLKEKIDGLLKKLQQ